MPDADAAPRPRRFARFTGRPFIITAAVVVLIAIVYTAVGFLLVPRLVRSYVPRYVQEQLKRRAEIGEVRVNPLLFKVEIKDFRLREVDGRPILSFQRLFIDFELSSLFRRAWTFAEIQLDAPRIDAVMAADGRLNLVDLLDALGPAEPAPKDTPSRRLLLQHAVIRSGALSFTDLSGRAPQTATVTPIDIEVHDIATLQGQRGPYAISATLTGGGVVTWEGEVSLVPIASTGHFGLKGFPLATAWRFVQDQYALAEPAGRVDAEVRYELAYRDGATTLTVDGVNVNVADLALTQRGETAPMLALATVRVARARGDVMARQLVVPEIAVSRGRVSATMARDGTVNWQKLVVAPPAPAAPSTASAAASGTPARPWRVALENVHLDQVAVSFTDESRVTPFAVDVGEVTVGLFAKLETGGPSGLSGTADDIGVKLARIAVRPAGDAKTNVIALDEILLEGGRVDLAAQQVAASRLAVTGGTTTVVRAADGTLPMIGMFTLATPRAASAGAGQREPAAGAPPVQRARSAGVPGSATAGPVVRAIASKSWTVALAKAEFGNHRLAFTDQTVTPAAQVEIVGRKATAHDVRTEGTKPIAFDAAFEATKGGRLTAKGQVLPDGSALDVTLTVAQLALAAAQPYVAQYASVTLRSGTVSTNGRLSYRAGRDRPVITYAGSVDVDGMRVVEAPSGDPLLSWKSLHADRLRFGMAPDRLEIAEVRLTNLDGRLVILKDKTLSATALLKTQPAAAPPPPATPPRASPPPPAAAKTSPPSSPAEPAFPVVIERVRIDDSAMHFADQSLVLPFATRVHALNGVIVGVSSKPGTRTTMKLEGQVDEFGSMKVDGALDAFEPKVFTDIAVAFRNVAMSTLSPYSATFAGRRIAAGTMDVNLEYKIDHGALLGENKVVLRRLQLGERVESPGAMSLPLDLAIAILSDSNGVIDLALPVRGNVDAPEFSYGALIWQAVVTVIKKVATAPFRALAGLFRGGGDGEQLESIAFEAGSDAVPPPERQKLQQVVEILGKRPQLKVTVRGGYEPKVDGEALRSLHVRRDLAKRLDVELKPGEDPGPVAFDEAKTQRALEAMLAEREGDKAMESFQASYEKTTGKKPQRVNPVLALVGRGSADRGFYEALFRRLVETAPLPETELSALGKRRAEATAKVLKEAAAQAAARVEVGDTETVQRAERNAVPTRLELGVAGA